MAAAATAVVPRPAAAPAVPTGEVLVPLALVATVVIMVVPLPPLLIDLLLALSISLGLTVLLVALYIQQPLQFSTFPSVLLVVTLFRLALNVASTRLILLHGAEGPGAAGHVIQAFGNFVVGGSYVVGVVVFLILVVINFAVITKGSIRIAEVAARFTLDAMPGKQLAIDADLNSGLITEREARARRRAIEEEADFYGAMDGASKFVRGDAVAGLVITAINIVGGFFIGVVQQGTDVQTAAQTYTILTVGDGLVSQIPALLISTAAGIIVTRAASEADLGTAVTGQLFASPRVLWAVSGILGAFALLPGLPFLPFVALAGAAGALAAQGGVAPRSAEAPGGGGPPAPPRAAERPEALLALDMMELEVGFELVPLVDAGRSGSGDLVERIKALRRQLALEMGFIVPPIHIRDNLDLKPNAYVILLKGNEVARGEVRTGAFLAINPGTVTAPVPGIVTREPAFGLEALWVAAAERERAQLAGYTVVDAATVVVTHLTEVIRRHAHELLGRQEVQQLLPGGEDPSEGRGRAGPPAALARRRAEGAAEPAPRGHPDSRPPDDPRDARGSRAAHEGPRRAHRARAPGPRPRDHPQAARARRDARGGDARRGARAPSPRRPPARRGGRRARARARARAAARREARRVGGALRRAAPHPGAALLGAAAAASAPPARALPAAARLHLAAGDRDRRARALARRGDGR